MIQYYLFINKYKIQDQKERLHQIIKNLDVYEFTL